MIIQHKKIRFFKEGCNLIVKKMKLDNTTILVDDTYMPKNEEERKIRYEIFNAIGCEIINNSIK